MNQRLKNLSKATGKASKESVRKSSGKTAVYRDSAGRFTSIKKGKELTREERAALANEILGKYAHVGLSSYDFIRQKQEEIAAEDRRWRK